MTQQKFRYLFGPVASWRLGSSLGVDPLSGTTKVCNFNCLYCQLGNTKRLSNTRKVFVPTEKIIKELKVFPRKDVDYYTVSSNGEPTLAKNLGEIIRAIKKETRSRVAVITNAGLIHRKDVQQDLLAADLVMAKLDACDDQTFSVVNRAHPEMDLLKIIKGLRAFKKIFKGKLALQIMFMKENAAFAHLLAECARSIRPDEIQVNTPLRPCNVKPLSKKEIVQIIKKFRGLPVVSVYDGRKKKVKPVSKKDTQRRHGIGK